MKKNNKLALFLLIFNMFITMSAIGLIIPIMPNFLKEFGATAKVLGYLISIIAFAQFIFSPIAGGLSDRIGRKKLIIFGLILNGTSQILFGLATDLWELFILRFLTGVGSAFIVPPIMAYAADISTIDERGKTMGIIGAAISFGFMIGPGIGGALSNVNLHFPFFVAGIAAIIAGILSLLFLPKTVPTSKEAPTDKNIIKQMIRSVRTPYFVLLIAVFVFSFGIANFQATLSMFLTNKFDYTPNDIAIVMTVGGFIGVIVQGLLLNRLFERFGEMNIILYSLIVAAFSMLGMIFVNRFFLILLVATLFQTATTLIRPAVNTLISKVAGQEQGYAAGMNNAYMSLGNMIGPAIAGTLLDWHINIPFILGTVILIVCYFITFIWNKKSFSAH
ncbi:MFS transporter [Rummeliibacillus suwonensis]|uniref:MFS transporter n=1 Tax=Rummeliibacillus suwonensis TaxID=1306154 RepID=UPI001AAF5D43|nr:MFS transporter [Rummeliibacillus suwonensis]MBO2534402.1 MFS transporter [Rummeliibacillus suwonensis]